MIYNEDHLLQYATLAQYGDTIPASHVPSSHWEHFSRQSFCKSALQAFFNSPLKGAAQRVIDASKTTPLNTTLHDHKDYNHFKVISLIDWNKYYKEHLKEEDKSGESSPLSKEVPLLLGTPSSSSLINPESSGVGAGSPIRIGGPSEGTSVENNESPQRAKLGIEWFLGLHGTCWLYPLSLFGRMLGFGYRAICESQTGAVWGEPIVTYTTQAGCCLGPLQYGNALVVCEGVADAESLSRIWPWTIASLTAKVTEPLAWLISFLTDSVVLCMDNDAAGERGTRYSRRNLEKYGVRCRELKLPEDIKDAGALLHPENALREPIVTMDLQHQLLGLGVL